MDLVIFIFFECWILVFIYLFIFEFYNFFKFYFILLYNTVLVLPYINMNPPRVYMSSQSWTPLPPPSLYHLSGSSQCTSPKHPVSCIKPRLAFVSYMILYMFQCHSPKSSHPLPLPQSPKDCSIHNTFESVLMRWMKLEPIIQSEVSQKEKHQYSILTHICGI